MKLTSLVVGCTLAMSAAALAHVDENDNAYLFGLRETWVFRTVAPRPHPRMVGRSASGFRAVGFDPPMAAVNLGNAASGLNMHLSALIGGAAVSNYCLDKATVLPTTCRTRNLP